MKTLRKIIYLLFIKEVMSIPPDLSCVDEETDRKWKVWVETGRFPSNKKRNHTNYSSGWVKDD